MNRWGLILFGCVALAGCARFQSKPLSPANTAASLDSRSLDAPEFERYLKRNLGRDLMRWPPESWDLDMLTLAGLYYHPSLAVARAQWAVAQGGETTAGQRPNPTLSVAPSYNATTAMASPWLAVASLDVPIETAGKRGKRRAQAAHLSEAARLNIATVAWQVRGNIRDSLLDFVAAGKKEAALQAQADLQEKITQRQDQQARAGAIAASESLPFRITLQKTRVDLADAGRQRVEARARLAEAIGIPVRVLDSITISFDFEPGTESVKHLTSSQIRAAALQNRSDILGGLAEYAASQSALQLEIAKQYPDIHLQPGYEFDQGDSKWALGLSVELPVLNRNEGPIAEARARREEAAARFIALQAKVLAEIDRAIEVFKLSEKNAVAVQSLAETQLQRSESIAAQLHAGAADQNDLLNAQFEAAVAQMTRLENQIKLQQSIGALENAVQRPLELPDSIYKTEKSQER